VQGRHPLQTTNAGGAAAAQRGPDAHAAAAILTCYVIDPTRSHQPLAPLLAANWAGVLVHDGWTP